MNEEEKKVSRKEFLSVVTFAIGGLITAVLGIPAIAYIIAPARKRNGQENWIRLGSTSKVEIGTPTLFKTNVEHQTGWITSEEELSFYILTDNGRDFIAMSNICTHLGCRVRWIADKELFFCPCHNAEYDKEGNVLAGPPPRPLNRYDVKVENDELYVLGG